MRIASSVTSISWIPSEAITGMTKLPFSAGIAHYDEPPPDHIENIEALRDADGFRFANVLRAWIEVDDAPVMWQGRTLQRGERRIADAGFTGGGMIGSTTLRLGRREMTFAAIPFPTVQTIERADDHVRFVQTAGGRTGVPAPRPVPRPPFIQYRAPVAWTTLALTIYADGRSEFEVVGASPFPRHWIYDDGGTITAKTGLIDFKDWSKHAFGAGTPWGEEDSPALVTQAESALERQLSLAIMAKDRKPEFRKLRKGKTLTEQGEPGDELYLLLDGLLEVVVDGEVVAQVGPGAILGERALVEQGVRTATLRALTPVRVAVARAEDVDRSALEELAETRRLQAQEGSA